MPREVVICPCGTTKRVHEHTGAGAKKLGRWVGEIEPPPSLRDTMYVKATYVEYGSYHGAREQFRAHRAYHERLSVEQLESRATELLRRRLVVDLGSVHR